MYYIIVNIVKIKKLLYELGKTKMQNEIHFYL